MFPSNTSRRRSARHLTSLRSRGTKGALLIEKGAYDEGIETLQSVLAASDTAIDRAYSNYYIALALHRKGDADAARRYLATGIESEADLRPRKRIESEIVGANEATPTAA